MTAITPFNFEGCEVRSIADEAGQPWFVGKDVCGALAITNHRDALSRLPGDERGDVGITDAIGRDQKTTIINEPGVYRLIITSRVPAAERFKRWLFHDVLPAIRKTGRYEAPGAAPAPEPKAAAPLEDVREETIRLWLGLIREARIIGGIKAARRLWDGSPLPPLALSDERPASSEQGEVMSEVSQVREFLQDRTEAEPSACIPGGKLYAAYQAWCREARERPVTQNRFGRVLTALGHPRLVRGITYYLGLKLVG